MVFKRFLCGEKPDTSSQRRLVISGDYDGCVPPDRNNYITTRRYNWFTFLPYSLLFQFRKLSNCYFLFIAILVQIPGLTPVNRYSTIAPLAFVLVVSELREFLEEWNASRRDLASNRADVSLLVGSKKSQDVKPGDIVKIYRDSQVPSDILVLQTSNTDGSAFVETSSLDGETNLRLKRAPASTNSIDPARLLEKGSIKVTCDEPNVDMYSFKGHVECLGQPPEDLALLNIIWRGSTVRNTDWLIGLVVYSGHDTTILLNLKSLGLIPSKTTQVENQMNRIVLFIFLLQLILCAIAASVGYAHQLPVPWYLDTATDNHYYRWQSLFFTYFILLASLIPVSLWVSVEILKLFQSWLIESTERLRQYKTTTKKHPNSPILCNSKNLHEELGQITHVFTDKTGTLTSNCMRFVGCCTAANDGKIWFDTHIDTEEKNLQLEFQGIVAPSTKLVNMLIENHESSKNSLPLLWTCLSVCHTCERIREPLTGQVSNQSVSPDEAALVSMAAECGYMFEGRPTADTIELSIRSHSEGEETTTKNTTKYSLLYEIPFTSDRKMMSVVVESVENGEIYVFSKGADSVILQKCDGTNDIAVRQSVDQFSLQGFRTLCCAYKKIARQDWRAIESQINLTRGHVYNRQTSDHSDQSDPPPNPSPISVFSAIESNLILIGCTAVEDKLQNGVAETLRALKAANIKVSMITGDKRETAINIGMSCGLISSKKNVYVMLRSGEGEQTTLMGGGAFVPLEQLQEIAAHRWHPSPDNCPIVGEYWANETRALGMTSGLILTEQVVGGGGATETNAERNHSSFSLVIDGKNLKSILGDKSSTAQLVDVLTFSQCEGVIFCRVSPQQKGDIVRLVKNKLLSGYSRGSKLRSTLAIGDGSNDVNMIKIAHVGIGISGREGSQAANSADYSVSQFSDLYRLLFVHGRWNYKRTRLFISIFLYKNFSFALTQFWFGITCGFSGQTAYDSTYLMLFNSVFGIIPLFVFGLWDMNADPDIPPRSDVENMDRNKFSWKEKIVPKLYAIATKFSSFSILSWCILGVTHSLVVFFGVFYGWSGGIAVDSSGREVTLWMASLLAYTVEVFLVSSVNIWVSELWSKIFLVSVLVFNIGIYIAFVFTYNVIPLQGNGQFAYEMAQSSMGNWTFWMMLFLLLSIAMLPLVVGKTLVSKIAPSMSTIIMNKQRQF